MTKATAAAIWMHVEQLQPWDRNPVIHDDEQVADLEALIASSVWTAPIVARTSDRRVIAGHGRRLAALRAIAADPAWQLADAPKPGMVPVRLVDVDDATATRLTLADNAMTKAAPWDDAELADLLRGLGDDAEGIGFDADDLAAMLGEPKTAPEATDDVPEVQVEVHSKPGEVYELGPHRLVCGDSTKPETWAALMGEERAALCHADPPYGMGKEADGVENDNLYREQLDAFQMSWWRAIRPHLDDRASAYVWGNAEPLWRLWFGGLGSSERLTLRNEIVWDKGSAPGMAAEANNQYATASERCLFFQVGDQFIGNINAADFPEHWAPLLDGLAAEAEAAGITPADVRRVCGVGMFAHWFSRSQFAVIPEVHYQALARAYPGRFTRPWADLHAEWAKVRGRGRVINGKLEGMRSYFDNAHDVMRDVWQFPRVTGEDRHGHATPKPVAMVARCIASSCPPGGIVVEPFGGSGSTLIAAAMAGRVCRIVEISPAYCDVTRRRWTRYAKEAGIDAGSGALDG